MGKSYTGLGGAGWGRDGSEAPLAPLGARPLPQPCRPARGSPRPLTLPPQSGSPDSFSPGPQRPWEGVGEAGELGFLGPCGLWTGRPISPPSPWSSHRPKLRLRANLAPKKQEENLRLELGDRKEKEVNGRVGWPGVGVGGQQEEAQVSPSLLAGGCGSPVLILPRPEPLYLRKPGRPLAGSLAEPGGGGPGAWRGGSVRPRLRPVSIFSAANPGSACCPPH